MFINRRQPLTAAAWLSIWVLLLQPILPILGAYNQGDEASYLSNFNAHVANSYSAVDDVNIAPTDLINQCKDSGRLDFTSSVTPKVILQPDGVDPSNPGVSTISASAAQIQCPSNVPSICIVPPNVRLTMSSSLNVPALIVRGELYWRDIDQSASDQWLCGGYIVVEENGKFVLNVQERSKTAWLFLKDNGAVHPVGRERYFGGVLAAHDDSTTSSYNPTVDITGLNMVRTWSLLAKPLLAGQTQVRLLHSPLRMGWNVGDRLGIASTASTSAGTGQTFRIVDMDDDGTVILDHGSDQDHTADFNPPVKAGQVNSADPLAPALLAAEVVNLSRNVIVTGDDFRHVPCDPTLPEAISGEQTSTEGCRCSSYRTQCTYGLHTAQMHGGTMSIRNTRVEKCGQRGVEGKYCLHFHKLRECPQCAFANNAIEFGHQRGVIVHGTHLSTVESNVLWDVRGAGIYVEDGNEMSNMIKYNAVVCPFPFTDGVHHGCTVPGTSNSQADTANNHAGIYTETAANDLIGNRVANSFNGMFLQANGQGRGDVYGKVCTNHLQFGRWEGNTFHGHLRFGTYTLGGSEPRLTDQSIGNNGLNTDRDSTCAAIASTDGSDRGAPVAILNNLDYGNVFVGHYTAGDIQHRGHKSYNNNNLIYWKETKNFADGCAAHIIDAFYEHGIMALPDQSTFIIQDTVFGDNIQLEANHHCNVGTTGFLCQPQYIFDNVRFVSPGAGRWTWLQRGGTGGGGIFSLSPPDTEAILAATPEQQEAMEDQLFPPGFVSVASGYYAYLLSAPDGLCVTAASLGSVYATRYDNGILCRAPLRALKIYSRDLVMATAPSLLVEAWFDNLGISSQSTNPPTASQTVEFHATGGVNWAMKQGFSLPVIPKLDVSYRFSLSPGGDVPREWIIDFSDPVMGNRYGAELIQMTVQGRDCGAGGIVSSQHDRRYIAGLSLDETAWGSHGACVGPNQPPDMAPVDCEVVGGGKTGAIASTECPELCAEVCDSANSFCHCGTATCQCRPGFSGFDCLFDVCAAARCGEHGTCSALYLGGALPVTSPEAACVCDKGWHGPLCDQPDPCLSFDRTCSGNGRCASHGNFSYCNCDEGYSGENCEASCDGKCLGSNGVWPYGCASGPMAGVVRYKCGPTGGCQYLSAGEDGTSSWCTYKDVSSEAVDCICPNDNDCQVVGLCEADGSCPAPTQVADDTPCNSKPMGTCQEGICIEPPSTAPTVGPTGAPSPSTPVAPPSVIPTLPPHVNPQVLVPISAASSSSLSFNTADKAIDADLGTRWESEHSDSQWISIDLGQRYILDSVELVWEPAYASQYAVEVSDDGFTWSNVFIEGSGEGGIDVIALSGAIGQFVRIDCSLRATIWGYSLWEVNVMGWEYTEPPTAVPSTTPSQQSCEGKCKGSGPFYGCVGRQMDDRTKYACDPNGGGGCQYLRENDDTSWCIYLTFDPVTIPPTSSTPTVSPSLRPTSPPTSAPVTPKPSRSPSSFPSESPSSSPQASPSRMPSAGPSAEPSFDPSVAPSVRESSVPSAAPTEYTESPTAAPTTIPSKQQSCEGRCKHSGPYYGCAWWQMDDKTKYACDPNGGGGCQYLRGNDDTSWCIYLTFDPVTKSSSIVPDVTNTPTVAPTGWEGYFFDNEYESSGSGNLYGDNTKEYDPDN